MQKYIVKRKDSKFHNKQMNLLFITGRWRCEYRVILLNNGAIKYCRIVPNSHSCFNTNCFHLLKYSDTEYGQKDTVKK